MTHFDRPLRLALNGYGLVGRCLALRLQRETFTELVAINDIVPVASHEQQQLNSTTTWLNVPDPAGLPWRDLKIDVVVEASSLFARRELEAQMGDTSTRILMTGDLRDGLPDLTLVPNINGHQLTEEHRVLCVGSDRSQCLLPLAYCLDAAFGIERANIVLIRPPYVGRAWGMRLSEADQHKASMQFDRVQAGLGRRMHLVRVEDPTTTIAHFRAEFEFATIPDEDELRCVLALDSFTGKKVQYIGEAHTEPTACCLAPTMQLRRKHLWIEGQYDPIAGYVERLLDCLELLA